MTIPAEWLHHAPAWVLSILIVELKRRWKRRKEGADEERDQF